MNNENVDWAVMGARCVLCIRNILIGCLDISPYFIEKFCSVKEFLAIIADLILSINRTG